MDVSRHRHHCGDNICYTSLPLWQFVLQLSGRKTMQSSQKIGAGRFAPSPTGRMHLGNVFAALLSWLDARSNNRRWVLRIEDLDPQRSKIEYARQLEDDLLWLGLEWDEGGVDGIGPNAPYCQSKRNDIYAAALNSLKETGLCFPCSCTRADIMATQAPHQTDGRIVYAGTCRPATLPTPWLEPTSPKAIRLAVPDKLISFTDGVYGDQAVNLSEHCGDFVLRRADGAWAYQLAVVVDDAAMGVTSVVRGADLLLSSAQQIYLYELLGFTAPQYTHIPLLCNAGGRRLSKRDASLSMEVLRHQKTPNQIIGELAHYANLIPSHDAINPKDLIALYSPDKLPKTQAIITAI